MRTLAKRKRRPRVSVRKAKAELKKLRDTVAPKREAQVFLRVVGETEAQALARCNIDKWPEGAVFADIHPDELGV
jgi:hypothetical protein